ncbi:MAG: right-handed parallel beta-helix repeat-containing protein [candidate division Zixibacteria bacterium]|nr:right-handed parallel beta-helix repeat-containing protein [Candidatus Tariuqbacter arcticus]
MKRRIGLYISALLILGLHSLQIEAEVRYVPGEYRTIQAGINAAFDGDTVLAAPGVYRGNGNYNIDFLGKAITVISEAGALYTIIEAEFQGRGVIFQSGETSASILEGFTIVNCYVEGQTFGGGILCENSSPTIKGNIISNCEAYYGAGIACLNGSALIQNNEIRGNYSEWGTGILCCFGGQPTIIGNTIVDNFAEGG